MAQAQLIDEGVLHVMEDGELSEADSCSGDGTLPSKKGTGETADRNLVDIDTGIV